MRVIFDNHKTNGKSKDSKYGNKDYIISPEIDYFLIPAKNRKCRTIFFQDDGCYNLEHALEEDNIKLLPEDLKTNSNFWKNKGLFVKIVYKEPFEFSAPLYTTIHSVFDLYRRNNGYARLIDDKLINIATNGNFLTDETKLLVELDEKVFSDEELESIFEMAELMFYN